ncbi:MAG TPA: ABC transporter permease [Bacteroidota bacterium]|nr:ABC transporter permease [Bacteroidota bacterium]
MTEFIYVVPFLIVLIIASRLSKHLTIYMRRSLVSRPVTFVLTLGGISLVSFVFAAVFMLAKGLEQTLVETGSENNTIVLRKAAQAELMSQIDRDAINIIETQPEVALGPDNKPLATSDIFVVINLLKKGTGDMGNVTVRGVEAAAMTLRDRVKMVEGRMFSFGTGEVVVGRNIAKNFEGVAIGRELKFGGALWTVVGVFDAGGSGFDSEIWGDVDQIMPSFGRPVYSSLTFRLKNPADFDSLKSRIEGDKRLNYLELFREKEYYAKQSSIMSQFITLLGWGVTGFFGFAAIIGAMITMYAAVSNRTIEIGTLRALGFRRRTILATFLLEAILIALAGSAFGILAASFLQLLVISTINFGTFTELAFGFNLTPDVIVATLVFGFIMGVTGGFLPAVRASRMNIVSALRAT